VDTRKMTLIATVIVIALLAVGIGYAYTAYTSNSGNNADPAYVVITQGDNPSDYTFAEEKTVKMDTYNRVETVENEPAIVTYYKLTGSDTVNAGTELGTMTCIKLGDIKLKAVLEGDNDPATMKVIIAGSTNFDASSNWIYFIGKETANNSVTTYAYKNTGKAVSTWCATAADLDLTTGADYTTLGVYYGYKTSNEVEIDGIKFMKVPEAPKELSTASITFKGSDTSLVRFTYCAENVKSPIQSFTAAVTKEDSNKYALVDDPATLGIVKPTGYHFKGWSRTAGGDILTSPIELTQDEQTARAATVYAVWEIDTP